VTYGYATDDNKHRGRNPGTHTHYNWDAGWNVINEEDNCGSLTVTYIHDPGKVVGTILARIEGSDPANGTYRYYCQDIIGSTRSVWNENKTEYASYDYTPYGEVYAHSGSDVKHRFSGQEWDDAAELYYFPFRYYSPEIGRWIVPDPLGMVDGPDVYGYVSGDPISRADPLGLSWIHPVFSWLLWLSLGPFSWSFLTDNVYDRDPRKVRYGFWCGMNWSAWHYSEEGEQTNWRFPSRDAIDRCCKQHDMGMQVGGGKHAGNRAMRLRANNAFAACLNRIDDADLCQYQRDAKYRQLGLIQSVLGDL
jgi:RHS repeat-associated protein